MARTALLVADLEGITGVDTLEALAFGGPGHDAAREMMLREVNVCAAALVAAGYETVRVSDSHRSGSNAPNLDEQRLHPAIELKFVGPDMYGGPLLDGVAAVACVGMHAAAKTNGFAAHTVQTNSAFTIGGRAMSETDLCFWLAAEKKVPVLFTAGDDVLAASLTGVPAVVTKLTQAPHQTRSHDWAVVERLLRAACAGPAVPAPLAPEGPLEVRFKTKAQAKLAVKLPGLEQTSPFTFISKRSTFSGKYDAVLMACEASSAALADEVFSAPGTRGFADDAKRLLLAGFDEK